jgi:elongation factor G
MASPLRNFGIFAHIDAGKTSLTERILLLSGRIRAAGSVDEGTTATDYLAVERERGITVKAACVRLAWRGLTMNLIDTPGHVDFGAEVERSLRVLDGAVVALCGVAGVQSRTETILGHCQRRGLPLVAFVNKMDRRGASFERVFAEFSALAPNAVALQIPWGEGPDFRGLVDLLSMRAWDFAAPSSEGLPLPPEIAEAARSARDRLLELLAGTDEELLAAFVEGREPPLPELARALRAAVVSNRLVPVLCGSAFADASVARLLDAVADYLPAPEELPCPEGLDAEGKPGRRKPEPDAPFSALVFKTEADERSGRLSWLRIWSGRIGAGDRIVEAGSGSALRVQKIFAIEADRLEEIPGAGPGEIVAASLSPSGGKSGGRSGEAARAARRQAGSTGSSLSSPGAPLLYEPIEFPEPVVSLALEPVTRADQESLSRAVALLIEDDPSLQVKEDRDTGRLILSGLGELHLEVAVERLRKERGVRLRTGAPQVSCREVLLAPAETSVDFERDLNGERVRARVALRLSPRRRGEGNSIEAAEGLKIQPLYKEAMRRGIEAAASVGPAGAWPVDDYEALILSFEPPPSREAELALEIAASMAARDCLDKAGTRVLEPWMRLELAVDEPHLGAAVSVLSGRSGRVESIDDSGAGKLIVAAAPLRLLFGLAGELRSASEGKASYQARFLRFEPLA